MSLNLVHSWGHLNLPFQIKEAYRHSLYPIERGPGPKSGRVAGGTRPAGRTQSRRQRVAAFANPGLTQALTPRWVTVTATYESVVIK